MEKIQFKLRTGEMFIPLIQLLKATNMVYSGSEAQEVVTKGLVTRNGKIELRKRAKIQAGETIIFQQTEIHIL